MLISEVPTKFTGEKVIRLISMRLLWACQCTCSCDYAFVLILNRPVCSETLHFSFWGLICLPCCPPPELVNVIDFDHRFWSSPKEDSRKVHQKCWRSKSRFYAPCPSEQFKTEVRFQMWSSCRQSEMSGLIQMLFDASNKSVPWRAQPGEKRPVCFLPACRKNHGATSRINHDDNNQRTIQVWPSTCPYREAAWILKAHQHRATALFWPATEAMSMAVTSLHVSILSLVCSILSYDSLPRWIRHIKIRAKKTCQRMFFIWHAKPTAQVDPKDCLQAIDLDDNWRAVQSILKYCSICESIGAPACCSSIVLSLKRRPLIDG